MNRIPGEKPILNKNRSSKQYFGLTRSGLRAMWAWQRKLGIPEFKQPHKPKKQASAETTSETK